MSRQSISPTPKDNERYSPPILPTDVVHWAWGLTIGHTGTKDKLEAAEQEKIIRNRMSDISNKVTDDKDIKYVQSVFLAVDSCVRSLFIIIKGRDTNFEETDQLREMYIAKNEAIAKFTLDMQSGFGRVASMTFGGTSATAIVATLFPSLPVWVFPLVLSAAATVTYAVYELSVTPRKEKANMKAKIRNDYQRNLYYQQYLERCKRALEGLLMNTYDIYEQVYRVPYDDDFKNIEKQWQFAKDFVGDTLVSLGLHYSCRYIHDCYADEVFLKNADKWASCESGVGNETCKTFLKKNPNLEARDRRDRL